MKKKISKTKLYRVWESMKARCYNCKRKDYPNYGGRGIKVCVEWKRQYRDFQIWALENGYKTGLELDRIDNNGNYEPGNCRFVTHAKNNRNKRMRCDNKTGYIGVTFHKQNKCYTYEIQIDGIRYRKSGYETPQLAYQAREQKLLELKNIL